LVTLTNAIVAAYKAKVDALSTIQSDSAFKSARNRLFWGSLMGSRIDGIRNPDKVEQMFRRSIMGGHAHESFLTQTPYVDGDGNTVHCFPLNHAYAHRGRTTYVRIGSLQEHRPEMAELNLSNLGVGMDLDADSDTITLKLQAPEIASVPCNKVTIILGPNGEFVEWYCGYPKKVWTPASIHEILGGDGDIDVSNLWVTLGINYNMRTYERRQRARYVENQERRNNQHPKHPNYKAGLSSVAAALDAADGEAELERALEEGIHGCSQPSTTPVADTVNSNALVAAEEIAELA
jgi:hypothetical protein